MNGHWKANHEPKTTKIPNNNCLECGELTFNEKFCSRSCSVTHNNNKRDYTTFKPGPKPLTDGSASDRKSVRKNRYDSGYRHNGGNPYTIIKPCVMCGKYHSTRSNTCSRGCYKKYASIKVTGKTGGWRNFGGNGKSGIYEGYLYQSSWELAWIVYHLDHNIEFLRPTEYFEYEFEGQNRKYYPDFYLLNSNEYVEVKGFWSDNTAAKINSVINSGHCITVIGGKEIKPYLAYHKNKIKAGVA